jgi:hypothetical protein
MKEKGYNIDLCKGTGLIQETIALLDVYQPTMPQNEMAKLAVESNLLAKASPKRTSDIVKTVFYKRYVNSNSNNAIWLRGILKGNFGLQVISQLFLIYASRANLILSDFILKVYWPCVHRGDLNINSTVAKNFILQTINNTDLIVGWSNTTQSRMAGYIISTLVDFRLLSEKRDVIPFFLHDTVANYLAHELHFSGLSDMAIINAEDWQLFGYSKYDTINHLERLSYKGAFIFQNSGEIVKIGWKYKTMEEFINELGQ